MDAISEARLALVSPFLADKIHTLSTMLAQEGIVFRVVQGLRSWAQQDVLYAQGRTVPGKIVTDAQGGYSWHNFGLAVDCVPSSGGIDASYLPDWNAQHPTWKRMEAVGVSLGLVSGANWTRIVDAPHFQINGRFPEAAPDDETRQIFLDAGSEALWQEVQLSLPPASNQIGISL